MDDARQPAEMGGQLDLELTAEVVSAYVSNNPCLLENCQP